MNMRHERESSELNVQLYLGQSPHSKHTCPPPLTHVHCQPAEDEKFLLCRNQMALRDRPAFYCCESNRKTVIF